MANYIPKEVATMNTPMQLLIPSTKRIKGVLKKEFAEDMPFNASFKTYGGTEREINGVIVVEDTAEIVCWYHPNIKAGCRVKNRFNNQIYDILGTPENLNQQNQYLKFKIKSIVGGA